jgi:hypothetical protein
MQVELLFSVIPGASYQLDAVVPTVHRKGDRHVFFRLRAGEEVCVVGERPGTPFTEVIWQSHSLLLFARDLHDRAHLVSTIFDSIESSLKQIAA